MKKLSISAILSMISIAAMAATNDTDAPAPTFTGKCEVRFDADNAKVDVTVPPGTTASICVPAGWKIHSIANTNGTEMDWKVDIMGLKNVALVQPMDTKAKLGKWWVYPVNEKGEAPIRFELTTKAK